MSGEPNDTDGGEGQDKLICSSVWGGIQDLDRNVRTDGVDASLYSSSCDGGKGGDVYYVGACKGCMLTRIAVADVVGHGQAVSNISQYMYESLNAHICDPDSGKVLVELNRLAGRQGLDAMTTAVVVAHSAVRGEAYLSFAGHPPVLLRRAGQNGWSAVCPRKSSRQGDTLEANLPLGVAPDAAYHQRAIPVSSGDRLFVYTDGVTEAPGPAGDLFGTQRLTDVLDANAEAPLAQLKSAVIQALHRHAGTGLTHDDVTLIVMEIR